jgi:glycosyltransferase involved in cell wall biosynthesis
VVDNGSDDHSVQVVGERFPTVRVLAMGHNLGAAARNLGVQAAVTPDVAFCNDDSWWAPGAPERAAAILDRHRRLALVAARTLVGPQERTDPVTTQMAASPLPTAPGAPGPSVLGSWPARPCSAATPSSRSAGSARCCSCWATSADA